MLWRMNFFDMFPDPNKHFYSYSYSYGYLFLKKSTVKNVFFVLLPCFPFKEI
jgi:hypothetical protein